MSQQGDAGGVALIRGSDISLSVISPASSFGMEPDYPAVTIATEVRAGAANGSTWPMTLNGLELYDPRGRRYPAEVKQGTLRIDARAISISDVIPGSAEVPANGVVTILGMNFNRTTRIKIDETDLSAVRFINSGRIDVVVAHAVVMHGREIRARNQDGYRSETFYNAYQRTTPMTPSATPLLAATYPMLSAKQRKTGQVAFRRPRRTPRTAWLCRTWARPLPWCRSRSRARRVWSWAGKSSQSRRTAARSAMSPSSLACHAAAGAQCGSVHRGSCRSSA